jgi:hypothetical protein
MADMSVEVYLVLLTAFAVPIVMAVVGYFKREGAVDTKTALADLNLISLQKDLGDLKSDVKELVKASNEMYGFKTRLENVEQSTRMIARLDKDMGILKVRMSNVETRSGGTGSPRYTVGGDKDTVAGDKDIE